MFPVKQIVTTLAGLRTQVEVARDLGLSVATKVRTSSNDVAHRTKEVAVTSRSRLSDRLVLVRGKAKTGASALRISAVSTAEFAGHAFILGKRAAADRRVQQVAATLATIAVTAVIKRHPAGALACSVWGTIAEYDVLKRGRAGAPEGKVGVARSVGRTSWKRIGQKGPLACFTYVDADGVVTERLVRNWRSTGRLVRGHCMLRQEFRCFRIDRIERWSEPH